MRVVLEPGTVVGPYEVTDLLGQGGMGVVYRALDTRLERTIALKVISKGEAEGPLGSHESYASRLLREAKAVASLNHPNVVSIFDVGETDELLYFAMEFVEGANLRARMAGDLAMTERVRILADVAGALHAAHRAGLVHRDVKPENVMVRSDGIVKVLDFGIARRTRLVTEGAELVTGEDEVAGTPAYMAPEQLRGERLDARSDQFSWGIVAFELLAGKRPFSTSHEGYALVASILSDEPPRLVELAAGVPERVAECVHRALSKAPESRYTTMEDVVAELSSFTGSVRTPRPSVPPRGTRAAVDVKHHEPEAFAETTRVPTTRDTEDTTPSAKPRRLPRSRSVLAMGAVTAAIVAYAVTKRPHVPPPPPNHEPAPACQVREADAAYASARVRERDGAVSESLADLERAVALDDGCAAAHLALGLGVLPRDPQEGLKHYQQAFHGRDGLAPRDLALLEAAEPFVRPHPDLVEWETRLLAAVYRFPADSGLRVFLGSARERQLDFEGARAAYEAVTRSDPAFAPAWAGLARVQKRLGDRTGALGSVAACLARSPVASVCVGVRHDIHAAGGDCAAAKDDAAAWMALEPQSPDPQRAWAGALFASKAPRPSVEEALRRHVALLPADARKGAEAKGWLALAVSDGRLEDALTLAEGLEATLPADADRTDHAEAVRAKVDLALELGDTKRAAAWAKDFLDRMPAYTPYPFAPDPSIGFVEPLFRAGALTPNEVELRRAAWLASEIARTRAGDPGILTEQRGRMSWLRWSLAYGTFAETKEEAAAALRAIPADSEPKISQRTLHFDFRAGKVLALAGDHVHAVEHLRRVVDACVGFDEPLLQVRASYFLGLALEARGDREGATAAYRQVIDRWGQAKTSRTAERARARLTALGAR
jgi:serine/threonine protein kinase/tetratricopeptide (TPR) repeat protein